MWSDDTMILGINKTFQLVEFIWKNLLVSWFRMEWIGRLMLLRLRHRSCQHPWQAVLVCSPFSSQLVQTLGIDWHNSLLNHWRKRMHSRRKSQQEKPNLNQIMETQTFSPSHCNRKWFLPLLVASSIFMMVKTFSIFFAVSSAPSWMEA